MSQIFATELPWPTFLEQLDDGSVRLGLSDLPYPTTERHRRVGTKTRTKNSGASSNDWYPVLSIDELCEFLAALYPKMAPDTYAFLYVDRDTELLLQAELGVADKLREITDRLTSDPKAPGFTGAIKDRIGWGWRNSSDLFENPGEPPSEWQQDESYCAWLLEQEYARLDDNGRLVSNISLGSAINRWEAWRGAQVAMAAPGALDVARWVKTTNDGERLRPGTGYHGVKCTDQILCLTKGRPKARKGHRWLNALFAPRKTYRDADGKVIKLASPKPESIARALIRAGSDIGDTVCDPFVGSGTHALAIHAEKRIGIVNDLDLGVFYSMMAAAGCPWRLVSL